MLGVWTRALICGAAAYYFHGVWWGIGVFVLMLLAIAQWPIALAYNLIPSGIKERNIVVLVRLLPHITFIIVLVLIVWFSQGR